jgi:acetolactate synthase-1/2/3 large subunit
MSPGGRLAWQGADVVIGIGTRLQAPLDWGADGNLKTIHLEIDRKRIGRVHAPTLTVIADVAEGVRALLDRIPRHNRRREPRADEIAGLRARAADSLASLAPQKAWLDAIRAELPDDGIFVEELTQVGYVARIMLPVYRPRTYLTSGYQGTLGSGYATALGAKAARPDVKVVSISGDGGFLFGSQELATGAHHRIGVVAIVFADGAYGNVKRIQNENSAGISNGAER